MTNTGPDTFEWFYHYRSYCFAVQKGSWELHEWWYDPIRHEVTHLEYDTFADRLDETTYPNEAVPEAHRPAFRKLLTALSTIYP